VTYEVVHTTRYEYSESVSVSHHTARLTPRVLPHQDCPRHDVHIAPTPAVTRTHLDYFGNQTTFFVMEGAHKALTVRAESRVVIRPKSLPPPENTPPWEAARDFDTLPLEAIDCIVDSTSMRPPEEVVAYARPSFPPGRPLLDAIVDLSQRIHGDFTFDPHATTVATPLSDVFRLRSGVCQDFARLGIACLRSVGLAARYISGYLETVPPPGSPHLAGADASHAWLAVYCPGVGWIDIDPTNNQLPSTRHITVAWGRDYADVSPMRGVILGGGDHVLQVSVDVRRIED
jgi:transglutaminase-like putative cysteine protease